jgi:hypothetical protein
MHLSAGSARTRNFTDFCASIKATTRVFDECKINHLAIQLSLSAAPQPHFFDSLR